MKECMNCKAKNRDTDIYCRNCGCVMKKNSYYVFINMGIAFLVIGIIALIILFIASYMVYGNILPSIK